MKMLNATLLVFFLPIACFGQPERHDYRPYKDEADRIVKHFLGTVVFDRYITLDSGKSQYRTTAQGVTKTGTFKNGLSFRPSEFVFYYTFSHPRLAGETFPISFTLDSGAQFKLDGNTYGLVHTLDFNDAAIISRKQALTICRAESYAFKKSSLRLAWNNTAVDYDRFRHTHDLADIWAGRMVWQVEARVKFRGEVYNGTLAIDVLTGQVMRIFPELPWD